MLAANWGTCSKFGLSGYLATCAQASSMLEKSVVVSKSEFRFNGTSHSAPPVWMSAANQCSYAWKCGPPRRRWCRTLKYSTSTCCVATGLCRFLRVGLGI